MVIWKMEIISFLALLTGICLKDVLGSLYEFVPDNDDFFQDCPKQPNVYGINDVLNLTQMTFTYNEGRVTIAGNITYIWEDIPPTALISLFFEVYNFQLGDWQPTLFNMMLRDFCSEFLDTNSGVYQFVSSNIIEEDRKCIAHYGQMYHFMTSEVNLTVPIPFNAEGRRKLVIRFAINENQFRNPEKTCCVEIPGYYYKLS